MKYFLLLLLILSMGMFNPSQVAVSHAGYTDYDIVYDTDHDIKREPKFSVKHVEITKATITMYNAVEGQCDDTPFVTADNSMIDTTNISGLRWVALSRNLLTRFNTTAPFNYGDIIYLHIPSSNKSGYYRVKDTMNKRFVNYVDILESSTTPLYKYENIKIYKVHSTTIKNPNQLWKHL